MPRYLKLVLMIVVRQTYSWFAAPGVAITSRDHDYSRQRLHFCRLQASAVDCATVRPPHTQSHIRVKIWQYEGESAHVPWGPLGDMLFELGAQAVDVRPEGPAGGLTLIVPAAFNVTAALHVAAEIGELEDMLDVLDWDQDPLECEEDWAAAARNTQGFPPIRCSKLEVVPVQTYYAPTPGVHQVRVLEGDGWGNGQHPSTRLCLEFLESAVKGGETVVDYGTGSGVLAAAAALLGAKHITAVDIDDGILQHAEVNCLLNGVRDKVETIHTRMIIPGSVTGDIVVANILVGPLRRLKAVLGLAVKEGGLLCLSGFRAEDAGTLKREYEDYIEWDDGLEGNGSHPEWGSWVRLVGRPRPGIQSALRATLEESLSAAAVS